MKKSPNYNVNREFKDRLFRAIFGDESHKTYLLELYNALNDSHYTDPNELEINTLDDAIYMKMKNDVSFIIDSFMVLFEQQSSLNPNMAFREFEYCAKLYNKYVTVNQLRLYGSTRIKLPTPQCYVFYNGTKMREDRQVLHLSDLFEFPTEGYEWTTTVLNVNVGHNRELMEKCRMLQDYSEFVACIRENMKPTVDHTPTLFEAVEAAVKEFILKGGEFATYLTSHRSEVIDMCITEFDEELYEQTIKDEGREEGLAEGLAEGETKMRTLYAALLKQNRIDEAMRVSEDKAFCNAMLKELGID